MRALFNVAASRGRPAAGCRLLPGHQLYDVVSTGLLVAAAGALTLLRPGLIYYWMKDITSEFLKIHVLFNALEILDKVRVTFFNGGWLLSLLMHTGVWVGSFVQHFTQQLPGMPQPPHRQTHTAKHTTHPDPLQFWRGRA